MIKKLHVNLNRSLAFAALAIFMMMPGRGWGQTLLTWNTFGNAGTETTEPSTSNDANISAVNLTQGMITAAGNANRFGGSGWFNTGNTAVGNTLTEAIAGNDYIQFVVTPNSGFSFTPTSFYFSWQSSSSGPKSVTLRSSVDSYAANLGTATVTSSIATYTITISGLTALTAATTFRLYGYGATATGGTGGFDVATNVVDVQLNGTTASTGGTVPTLTTQAVSTIGTISATGNGNITATGGSNATARGICWDIFANPAPDISDNHSTESGNFGIGAFTGAISSISAETRYQAVAYATNPTGTGYGLAVNFWTLSLEPTAHTTSFSNSIISQTRIDLTFDAASTLTNADGYIILQRSGSAPTGTLTDGNAYIVGNTIGDGTVAAIVTSSSATSASITGLLAGTNYYYTIMPFNYNGANNETYNYKTDGTIPSTNGTTLASLDATSEISGPALGSQPDPVSVSSLATTDAAAVRVFDMDIYDYATTDAQPTKITQVTVKAGLNNTADWVNTIQGVKLSTDAGSTFITLGTPTITSTSIVIPVTSGNLDIPNGDVVTLSLYVYLKSSGLTDNQILEFKVDATAASHGFVADATGSTFIPTFATAPVSNQMAVDVVATKYNFSTQPSNTTVNTNFSAAVEALDANNNRDLGTNSVTLSASAGTLSSVTGLTQSIAAGVYSWTDLQNNTPGSGLILSATGTLTTANSNSFTILTAQPATQASAILFSNVGLNSMTVSWTNGDGANRILVAKASGTPGNPTDGTSYTASSVFGSGGTFGTIEYVLYNGTETTVDITGLTGSTTYTFKVFEYNGTSGTENYLTTSNATSQATAALTYYSNGSGDPAAIANWKTNRDGTGTSPANFISGETFIIENGDNMSTTTTWAISGTNSKLQIESGGTLTANNAITLAAATTFQIDNGGNYIQNVAIAMASTIFQGTEVFASASNIEIRINPTGTTTPTSPGYGNLTINVTTGSANFGWSASIVAIQGNLTILGTGTGATRHAFTSTVATTVSIGGNFTVTGGNFFLSSSTGICTVNLTGNLIINGGILDVANSSGAGTINVGGNISVTSGTLTEGGSTTTSKIVFNKSGSQTFTSGGTISNIVNFEVGATSIVDLATNVISGAGSVTVISGGTLKVGSTSGSGAIAGNITATGGLILNSNTTVEYNGAGPQFANTRTFSNIKINNSNGITLLGDITVNGILNFAAGNITTSTNKVVIASGGSITQTSGHVNGNLQLAIATGASTYAFPVGTSTGFTPVSLAFSSAGTGGNVTVFSTDGASSNYPATLNSTKKLTRRWNITNSGVASFNVAATCTYLSGDLAGGAIQANLKAYKFDTPSTLTYPTTTTGTLSFTASGISSFSELGAGECPTLPAIGGGQATVCVGSTTTAFTNGTAGGTWSIIDGTGSATIDVSGVVTGVTSGNITVVYTVVDGPCTVTAEQGLTVNALPAATITPGGSTTFCNGGEVVLTASTGSSYVWSNALTTASITASVAGDYTVTVTDANGCSATSEVTTVTVNTVPTATAASNSPVTEGGTLNLTGGADGLFGYSWSGPDSYINATQSPSISSVTTAKAGTYTLTVTGANLCTAQATTTVVIYPQINYANVQWPASGNVAFGTNLNIYAQVYEPGVTEAAGAGAGIQCWIGYSTTNNDPGTWTNWVLATFNTQSSNNDEFTASIGASLAAGTYYYASRFQLGSAAYVYGGFNGGFWNGTTNVSGTLTVNPLPQINWANLQSPATGSIATGAAFNVYAQVYEPGVTDAAGQGAGITAWIGYSTSNTNPDTWTNWVATTWNNGVTGNNDEYYANLGASLPAGTYYYASRFKMGLADYVYGGLSGFWNSTSSISGVLTVTDQPQAYSVTGTGSYCTTGTGLAVGLEDSESGVTYTLYKGVTAQTPTVEGTGSAISFGVQPAGTYTVKGTRGPLTTDMTGSAVITMDLVPEAFAGNTQVCTSGTAFLITDALTANGTRTWSTNSNGSFDDIHLLEPLYTSLASPEIVTVTLTLTVHNASCPDAVATKILYLTPSTTALTWQGGISESWTDANNWLEVGVPGPGTNVTIPSGKTYYPTLTATANCNNITVKWGASLKDNGYLTLSSGAKIIVEHPAISTGQWHYISSPVAGVTSAMFYGNYLYNFNTSTNNYTPILVSTTPLTAMKGFALYPKSTAFTGAFVGELNMASSYSIATAAASGSSLGWYLVGNPYPSAIDWDLVDKSGIDDAVYIYINGLTASPNWSTYVDGDHTNDGSDIIAPTQGFFVKGTGGNFVLDNSDRVHAAGSFFKKANGVVPSKLRIEVSGNGYKDDAVVRFKPEATPEFDGEFDALKRYGDVTAAAQLYTLGSIPLAINSLPAVDDVPVGIVIGKSGSYTIAATEINDLGNTTLEDTELGISTDLSAGPYTFEAVAGTFDQRFILHFTMLGLTPTKNVEAAIYSYQRTVHINMKDQVKGDIFIYNISGQQVASRLAAQGMNEIKLTGTGNYIVKVISKNSTIVRKVFILQ